MRRNGAESGNENDGGLGLERDASCLDGSRCHASLTMIPCKKWAAVRNPYPVPRRLPSPSSERRP